MVKVLDDALRLGRGGIDSRAIDESVKAFWMHALDLGRGGVGGRANRFEEDGVLCARGVGKARGEGRVCNHDHS